jgi:hypothetical protein
VHVLVLTIPVKVWLALLAVCHLRVVQEVEIGVEMMMQTLVDGRLIVV